MNVPTVPKWEYLFLTASWTEGWHARWVNDTEIDDWAAGPSLFSYVNSLGDEGWELVSTPEWVGAPDSQARRFVFKRPKA